MFQFIKNIFSNKKYEVKSLSLDSAYSVIDFPTIDQPSKIGVIAGNGRFPLLFANEAKSLGHEVFAICHENETEKDLENLVDAFSWIKVGQLGTLINFFKANNVQYVVLAGGISRVKHFGDVKLDARGSALILKLRSTKDDVIMRGIAAELEKEGMPVIPCTIFMKHALCPLGPLTKALPTQDEEEDIKVGISAIEAMSSQDIGQMVVVREGVVVAVEAVEGTSAALERGAKLKGKVVVKFAKPTQDMRFDVPTIGTNTIKLATELGIKVLALEAGRSIILDKDECLQMANKSGLSILGLPPLVKEVLG